MRISTFSTLLTRGLVALLPVLGLLPRSVLVASEVEVSHVHVIAEVVARLARVVDDPAEGNCRSSAVVSN